MGGGGLAGPGSWRETLEMPITGMNSCQQFVVAGFWLLRVSSRIVARAVAAEVTRRKCFSCQNPPPHVGVRGGTKVEQTWRFEIPFSSAPSSCHYSQKILFLLPSSGNSLRCKPSLAPHATGLPRLILITLTGSASASAPRVSAPAGAWNNACAASEQGSLACIARLGLKPSLKPSCMQNTP